MEDVNLYEELGIEAPEAPEAPDEAPEQAPEQQTEAPEQAEGGEETAPAPEEAGGARAQSPEENRQYRALRQTAEQEARRKADKELESALAGLGLEDPYTGRPITNRVELTAYRERLAGEKRREFQESHGLTEEGYRAYISELPEVREAREQAERMNAEMARARLERDLQELGRLDPEIKSLEDLSRLDGYDALCAYVERGMTLGEAYRLTYWDRLTEKAAAAGKQAALNAVNGKGHLEQSSQRGEGSGAITPPEVAASYRALMPEITEDEIQRSYAKYVKNTR